MVFSYRNAVRLKVKASELKIHLIQTVTLTGHDAVVSVHSVAVSPASALTHADPVLDAALLSRGQRIRTTVICP